jgi:phosphoribosyl 1,2-cyclic phosphate phosphodiesterase
MEIQFLGTGTSQGVPVIACPCDVCQSLDQKDKRLRTSVLVKINDWRVVIDAGPDFRQQMLVNHVKRLNGVLITHGHKDHTGGLDDVRAFNWVQKKPMDIFSASDVLEVIQREFPYAFGDNKYPGAPQINLHIIGDESIFVDGIEIIPIKAWHGKMPVLGFRIAGFSYLTDASFIEAGELDKMRGSDIIVINALRTEKHHSHFSLQEAIDILQSLAPAKGFLTHISHQMGFHSEVQKTLPDNIFLAYDGLVETLPTANSQEPIAIFPD